MCWRRPLQAVACWRLTEDFIADYQQRLPSLPVRSSVQPGYLRPRLPEAAPEQPQGLPDILAHVDAHIMPGIPTGSIQPSLDGSAPILRHPPCWQTCCAMRWV